MKRSKKRVMRKGKLKDLLPPPKKPKHLMIPIHRKGKKDQWVRAMWVKGQYVRDPGVKLDEEARSRIRQNIQYIKDKLLGLID